MYFRLADHGHAFSTRPRGAELLGELEQQACAATEVVIDFKDVLSISYSFADEFLGELLQRVADGTHSFHVRLENVPREFRRVILGCLRHRGIVTDPAELFELATR